MSSTCYKLLERFVLRRISPDVERVLTPDQAGFRRSHNTCDQVAALTTHSEMVFSSN